MKRMNKEVWKNIPNFEGYKISNYGRIKSYKRSKTIILKSAHDRDGYLRNVLCSNGITTTIQVHRYVALLFVKNDNPKIFIQVNHKNEIKDDDYFENLEWCTSKYNNNYGTKNEKISKKIIQYNLNGKIIKKWKSERDVYKMYGYDIGCICKACKGILKTYKNSVWRYELDSFSKYPIKNDVDSRMKKVIQKDLNGNIIKIWNGIRVASRETHTHSGDITRCCKNKIKKANNFRWEYADA